MGPFDWSSPESLRPLLDLPAFGVTDSTVDVGTDQVGLQAETGHGGWNLHQGNSRKPIPARRYLDVVTLEEVEVRFVLTRLLADESEDGVEAAGTVDGLAVLDGSHREVFQLLLE